MYKIKTLLKYIYSPVCVCVCVAFYPALLLSTHFPPVDCHYYLKRIKNVFHFVKLQANRAKYSTTLWQIKDLKNNHAF